MLTQDGKPDLTSQAVKSAVGYVKSLSDAGVISPGFLTMKEQDKVEKFTNGQVGMVIDSLAHITLIKKNNPQLNFTVSPIPAQDGAEDQWNPRHHGSHAPRFSVVPCRAHPSGWELRRSNQRR